MAYPLDQIGPRAPGTIYRNGYDRSVNLVLAVEPATSTWMGWAVTEVTCTEDGDRLPGERERRHCTAWDARRDLVIA